MKGRFNYGLTVLGLLAVVGAFFAAYYISNLKSNSAPNQPTTGQLVVVARANILSGELVTSSMLAVEKIKGGLPSNDYASCLPLTGHNCGFLGKNSYGSYYAVVPILPNTVITTSLVSQNKLAQTPSFGSFNLAKGDVAIAITLSAQQAVAGYLQVGDKIDLVSGSNGGNSNYAFQNVPVLAIGAPQTGTAGSSASGGLVVLEMTSSQALALQNLEEAGDIYTVVLPAVVAK